MKLKLLEKRDEAKGTKTFFWEPGKLISFLPGQYLYYTLPKLNYPDPRGETRHFTLASSPTEGPILRLTTRMREESGYKKTLDELPIGGVIEGEGPNGTFVLYDDLSSSQNPQVFLAGGIGITPFRSMIKYAIDRKLKTPIYLVYSNSTPEEIAFRKDLEGWANSNPNLKLALTITKPEESKVKWNGLIGRIDEKLLKEVLQNWSLTLGNCTFWVVGPPAFIDALEETLLKMGVNSDHLRSEKFTGY